ncbi:Light-sensor Protein kinase [Cadophora gregata]|uniref:Light-sensor Protein kinase n=2 Tax=Cadophora gregata TaxID=51156 RepID=UPI0026DC4CD8|nr:Light-sensor Protein kinase [Cadophora gregata]KAK0102733.1 Light-sensor Protein kinase [Cadophora gregata]
MRSVRGLLKRNKSSQKIDEEASNARNGASLSSRDMGSAERVFPIRNLRSNVDLYHQAAIDSNSVREGVVATAQARPESYKQEHYRIAPSITSDGSRTPRQSSSGGSLSGAGSPRVSARSQFVSSKSGPPGVLHGIDPDMEQYKNLPGYRRCEDEPIHTPGAIQSFGAIVGLKYNDLGDLQVRIASENTRKIIGCGPEQLFTLTSFLDVLRDDIRDEMVARVNHTLHAGAAAQEETRLDIFQIILTFPYEPEIRLWCAIHLASKPEGLVICEFEEYLDAFSLKDIRATKMLPESPISSMEVTPEELERSTTSKSKPLPVIDVARQRKNKEFSTLDLFNALAQAQKQITNCSTVPELQEVVVGLIAELTGFHRVMFYRFDSQKNGRVDAELLNPKASTDVWLGMERNISLLNISLLTSISGLNYPASDIPKQARDLYIINRIRILLDREAETSRLVCREASDSESPLDLTHAYLRAMSPIHSKYLANMGVRSTMSISIVINNDLWGLVACHGYGDIGIRVSLPIRELCRNIGECAASKIQQILMQQRIDARRAPTATPSSQHNVSFIAASSSDLLKLVEADFALLSIDDDARAIGRLDPYSEAIAITSYLQTCKFTEIKSSDNINRDFPLIAQRHEIKTIAGLLLIPLNFGGGNDFLVFFRKGQMRQVKWAGNPHAKKYQAGSEYLEPRSSFARWVETISGTSHEWTDDQLDTAAVLGLLYGRFIEVWRQKGSAKQSHQLTQIRASSRELRTPLNAIVNYLEMALENQVDDKTRHILDRAQDASTSLGDVMNELMKLTKLDDSPSPGSDETFNLNLTAARAMKGLQKDASRKNLELSVSVNEQLPAMVKGDPDRLKDALLHLTSYAFKQSNHVNVEVDLIRTKKKISTIGFTIQDNGPGKSDSELDDTFQEFEAAQDDDDWLFATNDNNAAPLTAEGRSTKADLALIARYLRDTNGQIRLHSEAGKGTIFTVEIPFEQVQSSDSSRSRKLRNLFSPSLSGNRGLSPPSPPPSTKTPKPNGAGEKAKTAASTNGHGDETSNGNGNGHSNGLGSPTTSQFPLPPRVSSVQHLEAHVSQNGSAPQANNRSSALYIDSDPEFLTSGLRLNVLVAEDNLVSQKMLEKRIGMRGHEVVVTSDGQECHDRFAAGGGKVDVIIMDLKVCLSCCPGGGAGKDNINNANKDKMPTVDGTLATRMIRFHEKETNHRNQQANGGEVQSPRQRVPILAMSTALVEENRFEYIQNGFDGWIMKPIDFQRLDLILQGVKNPELKRDSLYVPGQWEKGGWFFP